MANESFLTGHITLPHQNDLDQAWVVVRLLDASLADACAITLSSKTFSVSGRNVRSLGFQLPLPDSISGGRVELSAEIHLRNSGELKRGDFRNTRSIPWDSSNPRGPYEVPVDQI